MKRLVTLATIAVILVASILIGSSDKDISVADTIVPNDQVISSISKASNSSARATITITMTGILNE